MLNAIITQPLLNLLIFLDSLVPYHDFGIAVILITFVVRAVLWPLSAKSLHSQKALKQLQPEVDKLRKKYKDKPQEMQKALMEFYKEKEVSPFSSCLPTLLQLPLLIGLYWVFIKFKDPAFVLISSSNDSVYAQIYPWLREFGPVKDALVFGTTLQTTFLGIVDLAKPSIVISVLAGISQFVQTKTITPDKSDDPSAKMMAKMLYLFPIVTIFISLSLPAALPLYWTVSTAIAAFQQYLIMHKEVGLLEHIGLRKKSEDKK